MNSPAVLFDVVDSNYLHVYAWQRAFDAEGLPVAAWHIHRRIGMDGAPLRGTRALLHRVAELGLQVVLAGSAPGDELEALLEVLGCDDVIAATTSSRDVDTAKPEPGIIRVALDRAGVGAGQAVFVGDAVWDAHAAANAGLLCIGVLGGGISRAELQDAGASPVFADAQDLLDHLESTRIGALAGGS